MNNNTEARIVYSQLQVCARTNTHTHKTQDRPAKSSLLGPYYSFPPCGKIIEYLIIRGNGNDSSPDDGFLSVQF